MTPGVDFIYFFMIIIVLELLNGKPFQNEKEKNVKSDLSKPLSRQLPTYNRRSMHQYCQLLSRVSFVVEVFVI